MPDYDELLAEYERLKEEKINLLERAGDYFSGVDERIDFLATKLFQMLANIGELQGAVARITDALASLELPEGGVLMPKKIEQIPYSYVLPAGGGIRLTELVPFSGYIERITIHWPDGTDALCGVMVGHSNIQLCQREGYLALNDATPQYTFDEWVDEGEELWVQMYNADAVNPHAISVTVDLRGEA